MRARRIIEGAAFGPDVLTVASEAFETCWSEIEHRFDAASHEMARETLATAMISALREQSADGELLRKIGLQAMARTYPDLFGDTVVPTAKGGG